MEGEEALNRRKYIRTGSPFKVFKIETQVSALSCGIGIPT
jgi:hypothetical protein